MKTHKVLTVVSGKRNPSQRIVTLDNGDVFRISEDVFIKYRLYAGETISEKTLKHLKKDLDETALQDAAYRLLSYRMRSTAELKSRLLKKGFPLDRIEKLMSKLEEKNYLNDEQFAWTFAVEKVKSKKIGPRALRAELLPHQLPDELLNQTIAKVFHQYPVQELIRDNLVKKKIRKGKVLPVNESKRLVQFLQRKGFTWDSIHPVLLEWGVLNTGNR
jgi:regulatory protein